MRTLACILLALLTPLTAPAFGATSDSGAAIVAANEAPPLGMLPRWAVPQSYALELRSDPAAAGYRGVVTIVVELRKASDHLWLHGQDLRVHDVTITDAGGHTMSGRYIEAVPKAGIARIELGKMLDPQRLTLRISFSATYNGTLQGYYKVVFGGRAYAMTQMEPISARLAFPCFDEPDFKAPLTLTLTIPRADTAVANTREAKEARDLEGWKTLTFAPTAPLPTYLYA